MGHVVVAPMGMLLVEATPCIKTYPSATQSMSRGVIHLCSAPPKVNTTRLNNADLAAH